MGLLAAYRRNVHSLPALTWDMHPGRFVEAGRGDISVGCEAASSFKGECRAGVRRSPSRREGRVDVNRDLHFCPFRTRFPTFLSAGRVPDCLVGRRGGGFRGCVPYLQSLAEHRHGVCGNLGVESPRTVAIASQDYAG